MCKLFGRLNGCRFERMQGKHQLKLQQRFRNQLGAFFGVLSYLARIVKAQRIFPVHSDYAAIVTLYVERLQHEPA